MPGLRRQAQPCQQPASIAAALTCSRPRRPRFRPHLLRSQSLCTTRNRPSNARTSPEQDSSSSTNDRTRRSDHLARTTPMKQAIPRPTTPNRLSARSGARACDPHSYAAGMPSMPHPPRRGPCRSRPSTSGPRRTAPRPPATATSAPTIDRRPGPTRHPCLPSAPLPASEPSESTPVAAARWSRPASATPAAAHAEASVRTPQQRPGVGPMQPGATSTSCSAPRGTHPAGSSPPAPTSTISQRGPVARARRESTVASVAPSRSARATYNAS